MSECGQFDLITVSDVNSCYVLRYLRLCDGRYFGGNTWDRADGFEAGVHVMQTLGGMLGLIGRIANAKTEPGTYYTVEGRSRYARIEREMSARALAEIFACDEQAVRDHFAPLISLAGEAE
jgi:hypothetical protein